MMDSEQESSGSPDLYLVHEGTLDLQSLSELASDRRLIGLRWEQGKTPPPGSRVLLYLDDGPDTWPGDPGH